MAFTGTHEGAIGLHIVINTHNTNREVLETDAQALEGNKNMSLLFFDLPFRLFPSGRDDDISDRLHHRWTVMLLASLGVMTIFATYVGDPIHCWCPAEFTDSHCNYTESYCWIMDTYYIPEDEYIPLELIKRHEKEIKYYQWVPMILFFLALCFKIPNLIWDMLNKNSGLNIARIVQGYEDAQIGKERDEHINNLSYVFNNWLRATMMSTTGVLDRCMSRFFYRKIRSYLSALYLSVKLCYIGVSAGVLFLLNKMLAIDFYLYGVEVISHLTSSNEMSESPRFPRITLCDFEIRQLQNLHRYTVQCVLSINLFNEKIFAFLWFWFLIMFCIGVYSLIAWIMYIVIPSKRMQFVMKYYGTKKERFELEHSKKRKEMTGLLKSEKENAETENNEKDDGMGLVKFTRDYLAVDGVFALRMLEYNTSPMVISDLVGRLKDRGVNKDNR